MRQYGDITTIHGYDLEPVDLIVGGSPCQDLSVAGKRAGLEGERSGLFMEMIRIIREMREKTNGIYPRYAVWENVPGAFSSNGGGTSRQSSQSLLKSQSRELPMCVRLKGDGANQAYYWVTFGALPGVLMTRNFGECPNAVRESHLSWILEDDPLPKYSLSARACQGILNRAERRGKVLPEMLRKALEAQANQ